MKTLIGMTDFIDKIDEIKKRDIVGGEPASNHLCDQLRLIQSYKKFLTQPLKRLTFYELSKVVNSTTFNTLSLRTIISRYISAR